MTEALARGYQSVRQRDAQAVRDAGRARAAPIVGLPAAAINTTGKALIDLVKMFATTSPLDALLPSDAPRHDFALTNDLADRAASRLASGVNSVLPNSPQSQAISDTVLPWLPGVGDVEDIASLPENLAYSGELGSQGVSDISEGNYWDGAKNLGGAGGVGLLSLAAALAPGGARAPKPKPTGRGLLSQFPTTTPGRIVNETADAGGYTVNLPTGQRPDSGYMMGMYRNEDPRNMVLNSPLARGDVVAQADRNAESLSKPDNYFGTWVNDGTTYLDVSKRFPEDKLRQATKFGERTGQKAGWDVGAEAEIPVGNFEEFIRGPEFAERLGEMNRVGSDYLAQHPTGEWWDMPGTSLERVYGEEALPKVAAFSASTSPSSPPYENIQSMSEYMRRGIVGEPTIQPDFRRPSDAMVSPGKKMPMESQRAPNLEKSSRGAIEELRADKVRNMAKAMRGDEDAMVFDRHWAKMGEDPARGIFANVEPNVIKGKEYGMMEDVVGEYARNRTDMTPRDFSANVWTGIRDTIQKTNNLFGTEYRGGAITGDSKAFADVFDEVIGDKAKSLKISVEEMERRLRQGDSALLSTLLGSPVVYGVFKRWTDGEDGGQTDG